MILTRWELLQSAITECPSIPRGATLFAVSVVAGGALVRVTVELEEWTGDEALVAYVPAIMSTGHAITAALAYQYLLHTHEPTRTYMGINDDDDDAPMPEVRRFDA